MAKRTVYNKFNRGEVDDLALARDDVSRVNNSAKLIQNFFPLRLGPMQYRPGTGYLDTLPGESYFLPFTREITDQALLEFTNNQLRVWVDDAVVTRPSVTTTVSNGNPFVGGLTSWTASATGAVHVSGDAELTVQTTGDAAYIYQNVAIPGGDQNSEHGLRIVINDAPVKLQLGTGGALYSDDLFSGTLQPGTHSFSVTPTTVLDITLSTSNEYAAYVESVAVEASGAMTLTTTVATADLSTLRMAQSFDVLYMAYDNGQHFQIERRGTKSWSIVDFRADDGPFEAINISDITLTASALTGGTNATPVTLTASRDFFKSTHVGTIFKLVSAGQLVEKTFTAAAQVSDSIKVTGVDAARKFAIQRTVTGSWATTRITLQSSVDDTTWTNVKEYSGNGTDNFNDGLDNQTIFYRLEMTVKDAATTNIITSMTFAGGSIEGTARVTGYTSATVVSVQVLEAFGSTDATANWFEGTWNGVREYPTAVEMFEGRLWWAGDGNLWGSVSDEFNSFARELDTGVVGDSSAITRTIAFASSGKIHWLSEAVRMAIGITTDEVSVRSSSFNEVLTPLNVNLKSGTNQGAAPIDCVSIDDSLYYVQRSARKIMRMAYNSGTDGHASIDLMTLNEEICKGSISLGIKRIVVTRQPETRLWVVLNDGSARVLLTDQAEEVSGWSRIEIADSAALPSADTIEDVVTLPGIGEDRVYFVVKRGSSFYFEKMAMIEDARGGVTSFHTDSHLYDAGPITIFPIAHLADDTVVRAWSVSEDLGEFTVASGQINLGGSKLGVTVGIPHVADYTSNKLGGFSPYSVLTERVRVEDLGVIARDIVLGDVQFGPSFNDLEDMPLMENGTTVSHTVSQAAYDHTPFEFNGSFESDSRVYLRAKGPCTIMALTYGIEESINKGRDSD